MRISRNLKKSTMRQRVCELLYTSAVQVYNHGRLSWREITYLVSSFFLFSLSVHASSRSTYINHFHPRTLSPHISKIRWTKREKKKSFWDVTGTKWEERRGGKGWKKENAKQGGSLYASRCRSISIVSSQGRAVCDTRGFARLPPFFLSLSLKFFLFFFIFEQLSLRVPPFLSNRFLSAFFFFFHEL